jgi:hypothetical protein
VAGYHCVDVLHPEQAGPDVPWERGPKPSSENVTPGAEVGGALDQTRCQAPLKPSGGADLEWVLLQLLRDQRRPVIDRLPVAMVALTRVRPPYGGSLE